jgi:diguanylate cyclase (GGDEF)-like protein
MPDLGPDQTVELKRIFARELTAGLPPAKAAYDQLRMSGAPDKPQLETLKKFFHRLAGTAAAADQAMLGKLSGACETAAEAVMTGKFAFGRHALQILGDGLAAAQAVLDAKPKAEAPPPPAKAVEVPPAAVVSEGAERILVVDDDPVSARLSQNALAPAGFQISLCHEPQKALQCMRDSSPDLVLLDVDMPGLDGFEICAQMRKDPVLRQVPAVFITHFTDVDHLVRGLSLGGCDYVRKPFEPQELVARVKAHLARAGEYRELTVRDALTGCYNTDYFKARLEQEMARSKRYKSRLVLGLLGIDQFKKVNDSYGYSGGDAVLVELAHMVNSCLRASDVVARYAGDEFAFLVIEASPAHAYVACNRLREKVAGTAFSLPEALGGAKVTLTISLGLAAYRDGDTPHDFLLRADQMLFEAKQQGRNRVMMG